MGAIASFLFSPFAENTYLVADDSGECAIVDPGCMTTAEQDELTGHIERHGLKPVRLLLTHAHVDHVFGNAFVAEKYGLQVEGHRGEQVVLGHAPQFAAAYGIPFAPSPPIEVFHDEGDTIRIGSVELEVLFTPGHSPAHICYLCRDEGWVICGDTLFRDSIGRTDLPGGDEDTLRRNIFDKLLTLPDVTRLYPGHMGETTVGREKASNPFVRAWARGERVG